MRQPRKTVLCFMGEEYELIAEQREARDAWESEATRCPECNCLHDGEECPTCGDLGESG